MEGEASRAEAPSFEIGDMAVHPAHGVGRVLGIEQKDVGGRATPFYVMTMLESGLKVMVAIAAAGAVGLRRVMGATDAAEVLRILRSAEVAVDAQPWSRRQRVYAEMLRSGSPFEAAKVLRDMARLKYDKSLSFGERRLLDHAWGLLLHELALAQGLPAAEVDAEMKAIFAS